MPEIDNLRITRLAKGISVARGVFEAAYDEFAQSFDTPPFKQIAEERNQAEPLPAGPEKTRRDIVAALRAARDAGWLVEFVFDKFGDLSAGASAESRLELQSIVVFTERFADASQVQAGTLAASRRCCLILMAEPLPAGGVKETPLGSGFLVGPHLVLTNHHVVAPLLDAAGEKPDPAKPRPLVRFDYHTGPRGIAGPETLACDADWLLAASPSAGVTAQAEALKGRLDFAVLRVAGLPGHARGWYDLSRVKEPPPAGNALEIWQFPQGQPMQVSPGLRAEPVAGLGFEALAAGEVPPRLFYLINTLKGSSGGLVLDGGKQPVALHDAGFEDNAPGSVRPNRGIPLTLIRDAAGSRVTQELLTLPRKVGWHPRRRTPILGRAALQELIARAQREDLRIIAVLTRPDPATNERVPQLGRSYTHMILEACLPAADHHVVEFSAAQIDPDPFLTARRIVATVSPAEAGRLPEGTGETTMDADATGVLVDATVTALLDSAPGRTVWLMIDDIDAYPIGTQWGSSNFLIALYRRAAVESRLRIVLVGLPRPLEGVRDLEEARVLQSEHLDGPPSDEDLSFWMQAHLADGAWPADFAPRLTRMVRSVARKLADGSLPEATARVLAEHARDAFLAKG